MKTPSPKKKRPKTVKKPCCQEEGFFVKTLAEVGIDRRDRAGFGIGWPVSFQAI
jgi:hypothetical protein